MNCTLDRTLFLLARCRLLVLELEETERQLERLASGASAPERALIETGLEALEPVVVAGRCALVEIEAGLSPPS